MSSKRHQHKKRFGQNFLRDERVIDNILAAISPQSDQSFVEIGPGEGALTFQILPQIQSLDVIEIDNDLIPTLTRKKNHHPQGDKLTIHHMDALNVSLSTLLHCTKPVRVIGNLPYNISTPIIFHLLTQQEHISDMFFMLQKEVVDRICATPGKKLFGRLSVMVQYLCEVEHCFDVDAEAFYPVPKVTSSIIHFQPKALSTQQLKLIDPLQSIVTEAFTYRRKTLSNALKTFFSAEALQALGFDPKLRPEQLSVSDFVTLSENFLQKNQ